METSSIGDDMIMMFISNHNSNRINLDTSIHTFLEIYKNRDLQESGKQQTLVNNNPFICENAP